MTESPSQKSPLLLLIDGHSLAFRAYYALAKSKMGPLRTSTGIPTSITFGFLNSLVQVIDREKPQSVAIAFDLPQKTFRHEADESYKANRPEVPEDFVIDLRNLQQLLMVLNLEIVTAPGYEADDVLATLANQGSIAGYQVKILSGDRDLFQLVDASKKISVLYLPGNAMRGSSSTKFEEFKEVEVEQKLKVKPSQVIDYKALCGDSSDNIPGVRGIGEKTAAKLLQEYQSLDNIYDNLDVIKGAVKKKLIEGKKDAEHARFLVEIKLDVPLEINLEDFQLQGFKANSVKELFTQLELKKFLKEIRTLQQKFGGKIEIIPEEPSSGTQQLSLFDNPSQKPEVDDSEKSTFEPSFLQPEIIDTPEKLTTLIKTLKTYKNPKFPVAWDTETTGLNPLDAELVGIGCCWGTEPTEVAYIPVFHHSGTTLDKQQILENLSPILESETYPKAFQNTKFDRLIFLNQGIHLAGVVFDTMLASYVLHPEQRHNLTALSQKYLSGITSKSYSELEIPKGKTLADLEIALVADYCGLDAYATFCLVSQLQKELETIPNLEKLFREIENPLEIVLSAMENQGIRIDVPYLEQLSRELGNTLDELEQKVYQYAGETFNLSSPKQLSRILFETLKFETNKIRKTKTGYSTNHATLEKLQHKDRPIIDCILKHRTLAKLKSTYVDALPVLVHPKTQRIHTDFNQAITSTGRLSSSNPNLQNIPIRTEFSRQIRKAFLPQEGWTLIAADYSQIELRILAHFSQEPVLVEAYQNKQDVHTVTAQLLFEKETVTSEERRLGKTINFGVIYGMGAQRFAREAGVSQKDGKEFIEKYRQRYGKVFQYLETMKKEAIAQGYVTTLCNRRRYFHFNSSRLRQLKGSNPDAIELDNLKNLGQGDAQLLRAAANSPIQGSSADIIKIAMVKLHQVLQQYQGQLLLQVHDELIVEVPPEEQSELEAKIQSVMENAVNLTVPLVVEVHSGQNWMEAK